MMNESLLDNLIIQIEWIRKLHSVEEMHRRFQDRTFEETFEAIGKKVDPEHVNPVWLGWEVLTDSLRLEEKYYSIFDNA
jgi:hypothetical protein